MSTGLVCAVCARVLDLDSFNGWRHTAQDQPEDHPAVPVEPSGIHVLGRCDFCSADSPTWIVPARDFTYNDSHGSRGDWAACETCADDIIRNDWNSVLRRAVAQAPENDRPAYYAGLRMLYKKLRKNLTGAPTPMTAKHGPL